MATTVTLRGQLVPGPASKQAGIEPLAANNNLDVHRWNDRIWLAIGAQWKPTALTGLAIDVGYAHLFVKDAPINDNQLAAGNGRLIGTYSLSADILTLQLSYSF